MSTKELIMQIHNLELLQQILSRFDYSEPVTELNNQYGWWDSQKREFVEFIRVSPDYFKSHILDRKEDREYIAKYIEHHDRNVFKIITDFTQPRQYLVEFHYMIGKEELWVYRVLDCWRE